MRLRKQLAIGVALCTLSLAGCRGSDETVSSTDDSSSQTTESGNSTETTAGDETSSSDAASTDAGSTETASCPETSPGLTADSIKLGGTYPLSGPAAAYSSIPTGADSWFKHLNETDGGFVLADGSVLSIEWSYLDDGYSPPKAVENVKQLVENDEVFLVLNPLGTPNNTAIRDYMNTEEVPQLFVATGASKWGKEIDQYPWTIGLQPDYESEGIAYAQYIIAQNPDAKIGILYQNDDFGKDYLLGIEEGLGDKKGQIVSQVSYETTDATVDNQISQIKDAGADAFIIIATPAFAIQSIQRKAALGWEPDIVVISSVSSSVGAVMSPAGPENGEGIVTSAYLKDPTDPSLADDPAIIEYKEILAKYHSDADPNDAFNLYGMNLAQTFEHLIEGMEGPICRQSIMDAAKNFSWDDPPLLVDGIDEKTGPGDGFPIQKLQLKQFDAAGLTWVSVGDVVDTASAS